MRIVVDTNILVSAMLTPERTAGRLVARLLQARHDWLVDIRILAEYREVLPRPRFRFSPAVIAQMLAPLEALPLLPEVPALALRLPDPDDLPFLEVAVAGRADALITGNAPDFVPLEGTHDIRVVSPREALELVAG